MRLAKISVQDFRNIAWTELSFHGRQQFFVGLNGQGKTNLLEAVGFATALRSFRTHDPRDLLRVGCTQSALAWEWSEVGRDPTRVVLEFKAAGKKLTVDGEKVERLQDYIGRFPAVVFSSHDQQLVRGGPSLRRRWLDLVLSATHREYLDALTRYHRALEGRNRLLKQEASDGEIAAFTRPMAEAAAQLVVWRERAVPVLSASMAQSYAAIAPETDRASLAVAAEAKAHGIEEWEAYWERTLERDRVLGSTQGGPHRDDLALKVQDRLAQDFASEGQQRTLAISLRLAEWAYLRAQLARDPIVLVDDVLSELDEKRRRRFWTALVDAPQVIATGTRLPETDLGAWQIWKVENGSFLPISAT